GAARGGGVGSARGAARPRPPPARAGRPPTDGPPRAAAAGGEGGLPPREFTRGKSVRKHTRLSKAGNARLRKALYRPTLSAIRSNPLLKGFFDRLVAAGKPRMQAVGACRRKLVRIGYGVLSNRTPVDPHADSRTAG